MNNGCICCTVRGDLIRIVGGLMKRRGRFDGIIIETTGLANPAPVAQTFFVDEGVRARTRLDAIVTVVDAKNLAARLADSAEAAAQIAFADVIILNKTDLVTQADLEHTEQTIRGINRFATIHRTERAAVDIAARARSGGVRPAAHSGRGAARLPHRGRARAPTTTSTACPSNSPAPSTQKNSTPGSANCWPKRGQDLLRTKGILHYQGEDRRFAFQAVHMIADGDFIGPLAPRRGEALPAGVHRPQPQPPATAPRLRGVPGGLTRR